LSARTVVFRDIFIVWESRDDPMKG